MVDVVVVVDPTVGAAGDGDALGVVGGNVSGVVGTFPWPFTFTLTVTLTVTGDGLCSPQQPVDGHVASCG